MNLAKRLLILADVILQNIQQGFGLLRTQINALKILDMHSIWRVLRRNAEH